MLTLPSPVSPLFALLPNILKSSKYTLLFTFWSLHVLFPVPTILIHHLTISYSAWITYSWWRLPYIETLAWIRFPHVLWLIGWFSLLSISLMANWDILMLKKLFTAYLKLKFDLEAYINTGNPNTYPHNLAHPNCYLLSLFACILS